MMIPPEVLLLLRNVYTILWTELREHYRRVRGKTERAEEDYSLIGRIIVSNNSING